MKLKVESIEHDDGEPGESIRRAAAELRKLADHIENDGSPYFVSLTTTVEKKGSPFLEVRVLLTEPWGG